MTSPARQFAKAERRKRWADALRLIVWPFQCLFCSKRFATLADLERHRQRCGPPLNEPGDGAA
jgi:hypothetical protein